MRSSLILAVSLSCLLAAPELVLGQATRESPAPHNSPDIPNWGTKSPDWNDADNGQKGLSQTELWLSVGVLGFTSIVLILLALLRWQNALGEDVVFKLFGLILVVGPSLFLVCAGWTDAQITPVIGLLGTALGFVFGRSTAERAEKPAA